MNRLREVDTSSVGDSMEVLSAVIIVAQTGTTTL